MENNKLLLLIAVVAGVFATGLAFTYIQGATSNTGLPPEPKENVLRVVNDLEANHTIDPDRDLQAMQVPAGSTLAPFVKTLYKADEKESLRGQRIGMPIPAGTPLQYAHLKPIQDTNLAPGTRALGVRVSNENLMGGLLLPGDRVDVIATYHLPRENKAVGANPTIDPNNPSAAIGAIFSKLADKTAYPDEFKSTEILSNIRIVGIGSSLGGSRQQFLFTGGEGGGSNGSVITLELTPEQAVEMIQAMSASANNITLLLRPNSRVPAPNSPAPAASGTQGG